ncbi:vitelline membrane outer layer protein 1 homolog [Aulostomus maculatus]
MAGLLAVLVPVLAVLVCGSCGEKTFLQRAGVAFADRQYQSVLTVNNGELFGNWTWPELCPDKFFAVGFSVRVEPNQRGLDDTALNGIRLICAKDGNRSFLYSVESHTGHFGDWSQPQYCPSGVLSSFQLRVEPHQGLFGDDTAVNNIKFRCSSNPVLEGPGMDWGEYGHWSQKCGDGGICGIETKMEEYQYGLDDSSLNDVRFYCCSKYQQGLGVTEEGDTPLLLPFVEEVFGGQRSSGKVTVCNIPGKPLKLSGDLKRVLKVKGHDGRNTLIGRRSHPPP